MASTSAPSMRQQQPPWTAPRLDPCLYGGSLRLPPLKIYNSLTRRKEYFVPEDPAGEVKWYTCGPTVYDEAHLGHARNFVSTDVMRRIMRDYFGFRVKFVMNITDVDDKIILRARQHHLLKKFRKDDAEARTDGKGQPSEKAVEMARVAYEAYVKKQLTLVAEADVLEYKRFPEAVQEAYRGLLEGQPPAEGSSADQHAKTKLHIRTAIAAAEALQAVASATTQISEEDFYAKTEDVLLPYLDSQLGKTIDSRDHDIFTALTERIEKSFFNDMRALRVLDPDVITRVTEFVPQIVTFTERIVQKGFAYPTPDGSVYFDIAAFELAGLPYARLEPWNKNDTALQADGEGSLASKAGAKRSESDFALWKASKPGEPAWPSPWGDGRPGWHIECSVMASEVLGKVLDIHSGGVDLRFPHHDNELAQSEAYWWPTKEEKEKGGKSVEPRQWINYFMHTGHLSISGLKMSKSLKNFITIKEALAKPEWNPRTLRVAFLLGAWYDGIEITEELLRAVASWENKLNNFFLKALDLVRNSTQAKKNGEQEEQGQDKKLLEALELAKTNVHEALCDSFNTPVAMRVLSDLVTEFNLADRAGPISYKTILDMAQWITRMVRIFGLDDVEPDAANDSGNESSVCWSGIDIPSAAQAFVYPASRLRDLIRQEARSNPNGLDHASIEKFASEIEAAACTYGTSSVDNDALSKPFRDVFSRFVTAARDLARAQAPAKELLELSDQLRNAHLWELGVYLEDRDAPLHALVRPVDKALVAARAEREELVRKKAGRKKAETKAKAAEEEKAKVAQEEMFKSEEYSKWDDQGIPTHDREGAELPKSRKKKLFKEWERQKKLHEGWKKRQEA